jgi:hypothetical protein
MGLNNLTTGGGSGEFTDLNVSGNATGVAQGLQGCRVTLTSDFSFSAGTPKVPFDNTLFDIGNNFDTSTSAFTCPRDGFYVVSHQARFVQGGNSEARAVIIGNDTNPTPVGEGGLESNRSSDPDSVIGTQCIDNHSAGDKIAFYVENITSGDTVDAGDENFATHAEVAFLGEQ